MLPVRPELFPIRSIPQGDVLAVVSFGSAIDPRGALCVNVPTPQLTRTPVAEVWRSPRPVERGEHGDVQFARNGDVLFGTISGSATETDETALRIYESIVGCISDQGYPYLLRVWNHVGGINADENDIERYKRFCAGRHDALTRRGLAGTQFPAASAVGMPADGVKVYFIAGRTAGAQVENPRQVSAYEYPPRYGRRSPSFARATVAQWNGAALVFVSGTASVVGHETKHAGNVSAQLDETLENLNVIIGAGASRIGLHASVRDLALTKVYIRERTDADQIAKRLASEVPESSLLLVESDICRRDLLLEIEGVVRF